MATSMNERTHFFIKIYLSHFILERVDVGCVWEVRWRRGQTAISTQSSSDHSSTSFTSWLGCSTVGHWGPQALSRQADSHAGILSPADSNSNWNWPKSFVAPGYLIILRPPASAVLCLFTQAYLLIDGSVEGQYITVWWSYIDLTPTLCRVDGASQSTPGSNGNEGITLYFSDFQTWSLTTRCSFVSNPKQNFFAGRRVKSGRRGVVRHKSWNTHTIKTTWKGYPKRVINLLNYNFSNF